MEDVEEEARGPQPPQQPPDSGGGLASVSDTTSVGGWVWIVLFGSVMALSFLANLLLAFTVVKNKKKHNVVYLMLLFMFAINLVDYSLLIFEFSLGMGHEYHHGSGACTLYQMATKGNPILQASAVLLLVNYAASTYISPPSTTAMATSCSRTNTFFLFGTFVLALVLVEVLFSIPTACFATIVTVKGKNYCEIDLSKAVNGQQQQKAISVYYLLYSAVFSYWLPLMIAAVPLTRLLRSSSGDKFPEVSVVLATVSSFFIFYLLHGSVVLVRHTLDAAGIPMATYQSWMIKVAQSLLWLVAYFWHVTRPALAILLDPDLKCEVGRLFGATDYDSVEQNNQTDANNRLVHLVPLKVMTNSSKTRRLGDDQEEPGETTSALQDCELA